MDTATLNIAWVRYFAPTPYRGGRIRVRANGRVITRGRDYSMEPSEQALAMVREVLGLGPEAQFTTVRAKGDEVLYILDNSN